MSGRVDNDAEIPSIAHELMAKYCFLQEYFNMLESEELYRSLFIIELIAVIHLSDITSFVNVPGWDTQAMASSKNGEGIIALALFVVCTNNFFIYSFLTNIQHT